MNKIARNYLIISGLLAASLVPVACTGTVEEFREVTAERIARPAFMVERYFVTPGPMKFRLWERAHQRYAPANIYIEGDGESLGIGLNRSADPTPSNPVALHLASRDLGENVFYIGRPCQYMENSDEEACPAKFWGNRRFSPEVLSAYNTILDEIKARYNITEFNMIGYDGGANIAALLSAQRKDIVSLRTVGGNLSTEVTEAHRKSPHPMDGDSFNAKNVAPHLARLPQHHFIGAGDNVTPPAVYHSFIQAMGPSECVHYTLVPDADHERGWVNKWPELLQSTVACPAPAISLPDNYIPAPLPEIPPELKPEKK